MHEVDWRTPTPKEHVEWAHRALKVLDDVKLKPNFPIPNKFGATGAPAYEWKVYFELNGSVCKKHRANHWTFRTPINSLKNNYGVVDSFAVMVGILSKLMNELPDTNKSDYDRVFQRLVHPRALALIQVNKEKAMDWFMRLSNDYNKLCQDMAPVAESLFLKRKNKNEKINKKAFKKRFNKNEEKVIDCIAELAIMLGCEDNLTMLSFYMKILMTVTLDDLVEFRKRNQVTLRYLDDSRISEACKLALAKKTIET